jgi:hypothetical protein
MKFIVHLPRYNPNSGGSISLHRLLELLVELGYDSYVLPSRLTAKIRKRNEKKISKPFWIYAFRSILKPRKTLTLPNGQVVPLIRLWDLFKSPNRWIVIYPEIIPGNPIRARHVVRWFLHTPGFHTGIVDYGSGEYHIDFRKFGSEFQDARSYRAPFSMKVVAFPFHIYNLNGALPAEERSGLCYMVRKGSYRDIGMDLSTAIRLDGLTHEDCAKIFKRSTQFICFDPHTAYSQFAALCGAQSVVVPEPGVTAEQVYYRDSERYGIAYGFDDLPRAIETVPLIRETMQLEEAEALKIVKRFAEDVQAFFRKSL